MPCKQKVHSSIQKSITGQVNLGPDHRLWELTKSATDISNDMFLRPTNLFKGRLETKNATELSKDRLTD